MNTTKTRTTTGDVYMQIRDLKKIKTLMVVQDVSQRQLAIAAGYGSHAYMGRILRGEVNTLSPEAAVRIAHFFGVAVHDLFVTKVTTNSAHNVRSHAA